MQDGGAWGAAGCMDLDEGADIVRIHPLYGSGLQRKYLTERVEVETVFQGVSRVVFAARYSI